MRTSSTEKSSMPLRTAIAWRRKLRTLTPGISSGCWKPRNRPAGGPLVGGEGGDVLALEADAAAGDLVGGVGEEGVGEGRLARAVGAHEGVDLAVGRRRGSTRAGSREPSTVTWRSSISSRGAAAMAVHSISTTAVVETRKAIVEPGRGSVGDVGGADHLLRVQADQELAGDPVALAVLLGARSDPMYRPPIRPAQWRTSAGSSEMVTGPSRVTKENGGRVVVDAHRRPPGAAQVAALHGGLTGGEDDRAVLVDHVPDRRHVGATVGAGRAQDRRTGGQRGQERRAPRRRASGGTAPPEPRGAGSHGWRADRGNAPRRSCVVRTMSLTSRASSCCWWSG